MREEDLYFAKSIKKLRKSLGLTQQEMADMICVRKTSICNYESGYATPTLKTLKKLMTVFNLEASYFISSKPEVNKRSAQFIFGTTIPFYKPANIRGLTSANKMYMDSALTLPSSVEISSSGLIATLAPDNSMNLGNICRNCCVVIDTRAKPANGSVFAAIHNDELIIRRYVSDENGIHMQAESSRIPAYLSSQEIPENDFRILGTITKIIADA